MLFERHYECVRFFLSLSSFEGCIDVFIHLLIGTSAKY